MERKTNALVITPNDSVAVAIEKLVPGDTAFYKLNGEEQETRIATEVPIYHKFARTEIKAGEKVYKYGQVIGEATRDIRVGEHIHTHNIISIREAIQH